MKHIKIFIVTAALAAIAVLATGCILEVHVEPTTVRAQNDLYNLIVDVNGAESDVIAIDLKAVIIGDVVYSRINAGDITSTKEIDETGTVNVYIGSAEVTVDEFPIPITYIFEDIDPMETYIDANQLNTVVFDETTAGVIFSVLAKKLRKAKSQDAIQ